MASQKIVNGGIEVARNNFGNIAENNNTKDY